MLGPFQLPGEQALLEGVSSFRPANGGGMVYDRHASELMALRPATRSACVAADGVELEVWEGAAGFGFVVGRITVTDRDELHRREPALAMAANAALAERYGAPEPMLSGYQSASVLYWHRILIEPGDDLPRAVRDYGMPCEAGEDAMRIVVANGFTSLGADDARTLAEVQSGLIAATEDWLLADALSRRLRDALILAGSDDAGTVAAAVGEAERTSYLVALAVLVIDERKRNLANTVQEVHRAATDVWGLSEVRSSLLENAESVGSLVAAVYERRAQAADARRNNILFGFTAVTVLQSILLIVDFADADPVGFGSVTRVVLAGLVLVATLCIIAGFVRRPPAGPQAI